MRTSNQRPTANVLRVLGLLLFWFLMTGCYPFRNGVTYYPPGAINQPTGTATRQWQTAQATKSRSDGLVLFEASWVDGSDRLGPAAIDRLEKACASGCVSPTFVTLERSQVPALDERRVQAILDFANNRGVSISPDSIVLSRPDGSELHGEESVRVAREMMQGNQQNRSIFGFNPTPGGLFGGTGYQGFYGVGR